MTDASDVASREAARKFKEGDRVTISTHATQGTVRGLSAYGHYVIVQIDGEPGPRACRPENVKKVDI